MTIPTDPGLLWPVAELQPVGSAAAARPGRIAVIDDDAAVRETIVAMLERLGFSAAGIDPNSDILAAVAAIHPSLIILDLALGRRDAVEVLHGLADGFYRGRVLLVSGRGAETLLRVNAIGMRRGLKMLVPLAKPVGSNDIENALAAADLPDSSELRAVTFDLAEAVASRQLELWYQPKLTLSSQTLCGVEALVRLRDPEIGMVLPSSFMPFATMDAYEAMTAFVIDSLARDWSFLRRHGAAFTLSFNASIKMIQRACFIEMIRDAWPHFSKRPRLIVEVTEDELITDLRTAQEIATRLKLYDVDIAIDDFGAGYSSFASLSKLPFSEIKLDKSFVTGCGSDERRRAFCIATAALARQFEMQSVAEGIETAQDLATVEEAGFDIGQGFYFARPMPLDDFIGLAGKMWSHRSSIDLPA